MRPWITVYLLTGLLENASGKRELSFKEVLSCIPKDHYGVRRDVWRELQGDVLESLTNDSRFPNNSTSTEFVSNLEVRSTSHDNFGQKLSAYFVAPLTGNYTFFMACDDRCELSISTDHVVYNIHSIIKIRSWTPFRGWDRFGSSQHSGPIPLLVGHLYYIQAIMVQGAGDDHISVGVKFPDGKYERPLTSSFLIRYLADRQGTALPGEWGKWTPCSVTCALGVQYRNRSCYNPPPIYTRQTSIDWIEARRCPDIKPCPVPRIITNTSSFTSTISWFPVILSEYTVQVIGYNVTYKIKPDKLLTSRTRRSIRRVVSNPDRGHVVVPANVRVLELIGLRAHRKYCVRVATLTSDGNSVASPCVNITTQQGVPTSKPISIKAHNKTGPYQVHVEWEHIPKKDINGILLGYILDLRAVSTAKMKPQVQTPIRRKVSASETSVVIEGLETYTAYSVQVAAFTVKGNGPYSDPIYVETCRCPKKLYTNWWSLPPLSINSSTHAHLQGSLPELLRKAIEEICDVCNQRIKTTIDFISSNGRNSQAQKISQLAVRKAMKETNGFSFPMTAQKDGATSGGDLSFVPVQKMVSSIFYFRRNMSPEVFAKMLGSSVFKCWPLVVFIMAMSVLAGLTFWISESGDSSTNFPRSFVSGVIEGTWYAFVSMSTVGYGDRFSVSHLSRVLAMFWIIVGLVIIALFVSLVSSSLVVTIVITTRFPESSGMVGVVEGSIEFRIATKINGTKGTKCIAYETQQEMMKDLTQGKLDGVLLDAIGAARQDYPIPSTGYKLVKTYELPFSYGIYMTGDAAKLKRDFTEYLQYNPFVMAPLHQKNFSEAETETEPGTAPPPKTEILQINFFDPSGSMYVASMQFTGGFLGGLVFCGLIYTIVTNTKALHCKKKTKRVSAKEFTSELREVLLTFHKNCDELCSRLREKHFIQRRDFLRRRIKNIINGKASIV